MKRKQTHEAANTPAPENDKKRYRGDTIFRNYVNNFESILDYYFDASGMKDHLQCYINNAFEDPTVCIYFDFPGVGKTATVHHAVMDAGDVLCIEIPLTCQLAGVVTMELQNFSTDYFKGAKRSEDDVLGIIKKVCAAMLKCAFEQVVHWLEQDQHLLKIITYGNGLHLPPDLQTISSSISDDLETLLDQCRKLSGKSKILLHFEECQEWSVISTFMRQEKDNRALPLLDHNTSITDYLLIGLSSVLKEMLWDKKLRAVMTGTNVDLERRVVIDSTLKCTDHSSIPYSTVSVIQNIVNNYVALPTTIAQKDINTVYDDLKGPMRIVRFFLQALWEKCSKIPFDAVTIQDMRYAVEIAYSNFSKEIAYRLEWALSRKVVNEMMLNVIYPRLMGGRYCIIDFTSKKAYDCDEEELPQITDDMIMCIHFQTADIPSGWLSYADQGVVRWLIDNGSAYMMFPFPMLEKYWKETSNMFTKEVRAALMSYVVSGTTSQGGNSWAFQLAIAIELTVRSLFLLELLKYHSNCIPHCLLTF
jgi:hypothetical protein